MSIPSFGAVAIGPTFTFTHIEDDTLVTNTYRARADMAFGDMLRYRELGARQLTIMARLVDLSRKIQEPPDETMDPQEQVTQLQTQLDLIGDANRSLWDLMLEQVLLCLDPRDLDRLRPILEAADVNAVTGLRDWLRDTVVDRIPQTVQEVAKVDPTLLPPLPGSANSPTGGDNSSDEGSESTTSPPSTSPS